ncbi:MAG: zinc-ribbon domain-containing protein [Candidatus Lokiarchaeota archaeon]|nr:zinc-ribbon domain-containing protein [Candidatus Lokiarchaeota archaeon]
MVNIKNGRSVELKVKEAYSQDLGKFKVRINNDIMKYLGIKTSGGIVGLHGRKVSAAIARPLFSTYAVKDVIRMDKFVRKNCGVFIGDYVSVKMVKPIPAQRISLLLKTLPLRADDFKQILKRKLMGIPVSPGDIIVIQLEKTRIPLAVSRLQPAEFCFVRDTTSVDLIEKKQEEEIESIDSLIKRKQLIEEILKKVEAKFDQGNIGAEEFSKLYEQYKEELLFVDFQINELIESRETQIPIRSTLEEPEDSVFCPFCGVQIPLDSEFCPSCGKKLGMTK